MPFLAELPNNGRAVRPSDVGGHFNQGQDLQCPYCGDLLRFRNEGTDEHGRTVFQEHFWHLNRGGGEGGGSGDLGGCERGGESARHEKGKQRMLEQLKPIHGKPFVEKKIGDRVVDCGVEYEGVHNDLRGVVVEVQFQNTSKDLLQVTRDYMKHGYGVYWAFVTTQTYSHLYDAKETFNDVYRGRGDGPWFGEVAEVEADDRLGERFFFDNFEYPVRELGDLLENGLQSVELKIEVPFELAEAGSAYLTIERRDVDTTDPELSVAEVERLRPAKAIADAKFE